MGFHKYSVKHAKCGTSQRLLSKPEATSVAAIPAKSSGNRERAFLVRCRPGGFDMARVPQTGHRCVLATSDDLVAQRIV